MSTVFSYDKCPRCGKKAVFATEIRNGDTVGGCDYCGYFVYEDTEYYPRGHKHPTIFIRIRKEGEPFGMSCLRFTDGRSQIRHFTNPPSAKLIAQFKKKLKWEGVDPKRSYLTAWDDEAEEVLYLVGIPPDPEE